MCHVLYLVKPDASQDEIRAAFEDNSGGQIFSQAVSVHDLQLDFVHFAEISIYSQLVQSRQSGARAAFAEIQTRNQDLRKIEETITQLAQMMQDVGYFLPLFLSLYIRTDLLCDWWNQMATLVLEQDEAVISIENNAVATEGDMQSG